MLSLIFKNLQNKDIPAYLRDTDISELHALKLELDDLYYNTGESDVSDDRYDKLKQALQDRDPNFVPPVGAKLREKDNRALLPYWLGSADKVTPQEPEVLDRWLAKNNNINNINNSPSFVITEKLDGVSCLLSVKNNVIKLFTRGDGIEGADISYLAKYFTSIPNKLPNNFSVRGELIIAKKVFKKKYKNKTVNGREYKNSRNMVSGLIGGKTVREGLSDVMFVAYEIVSSTAPKLEDQLFTLKNNLGFFIVNHIIVNNISIPILEEILKNFKHDSLFEIDGIVITSNKPYDRNTSGNPKYMIAFKVNSEDDTVETEVTEVEWNISKWGQLKPVAVVKPVNLVGVTISRATAHNAKYVEENKLGPGSIIKITRSKDVIPYIVSIVSPSKEPQMPDIPYNWDETHVNISVEKNQNIMCVKLISDFFSKFGIKFVSEATVTKLFNNGLDTLLKIISADKNRLLQVPEFHEKSAERIYTNIRNGLQNIKLSTLLGASGIFGFGIGRKRVEALLLDIPDLLTVYKTRSKEDMINEITKVEGFSVLTATKIVNNLKYADLFVQRIMPYISFQKNNRISNIFTGHKYVMTGFRDKKLEDEITNRGGKVTTTVSKNTTGLIIADKKAVSSKLEKAIELNIPVYDRQEFLEKLGL